MPAWRDGEFRLVSVALVAAAMFGAASAKADTIDVHVDQARVVKMPERVATIVIGNPLIADATLQGGGILVVTGKGYGSTNLLALDRTGRVLLDKTIEVSGPGSTDVVVVYKGVDRESYSCTPVCAPRITLGDSDKYFASTLNATGTRNGLAASGAK